MATSVRATEKVAAAGLRTRASLLTLMCCFLRPVNNGSASRLSHEGGGGAVDHARFTLSPSVPLSAPPLPSSLAVGFAGLEAHVFLLLSLKVTERLKAEVKNLD